MRTKENAMQYVVSIYYPGQAQGLFYKFGTSRDIAAAFVGALCANAASEGRNFTLEDEDGAIVVMFTAPTTGAA